MQVSINIAAAGRPFAGGPVSPTPPADRRRVRMSAAGPPSQRRFAVLRTGRATDYTERTHGGYGRMLERLLRDGGEEWDIFSVIDGDFSFEDRVHSYDGFVITGSAADAHAEDVPWILRLCGVLQALHRDEKKMLGVCFGHQVLARALGGRTGRAEVGWELGVKSLRLDREAISALYGVSIDSPLCVIESHRDQVSSMPPGAVLIASSEKTPIEMFSIGRNVLAMQCHPEFSEDVMVDIIQIRLSSNAISVEVASEAIQSFKENRVNPEPVKDLCKSFLKGDSKNISVS